MSSTRLVKVDDTDPQIQYTGDWFADQGSQDDFGNFGPTFLKSEHGTQANTASFSFSFKGSSIAVFGTNNVSLSDNVSDPTWECLVDEIKIPSKPFQFFENNWVLCDQGRLVNGQHTLVVNVINNTRTFWLDSIEYTPDPSASLASSIVKVANNDPQIQYDSSWSALTDDVNITTKTGSSMSFNFTGKSLGWVGWTITEHAHNATTGTFSIDNGPPTVFKLKGLPPGDVPTAYNQVYFTTPELSPGDHSLLVTYQGSSDFTPLTLDYIWVVNASAPQPSGIATTQPPPTATNNNVPAKKSSNIGAIVGGIVAGVLVILLLLAAFLIYRRRKRPPVPDLHSQSPRTAPQLTPFLNSHRESNFEGFTTMSSTNVSRASAGPAAESSSYPRTLYTTNPTSPKVTSPTSPTVTSQGTSSRVSTDTGTTSTQPPHHRSQSKQRVVLAPTTEPPRVVAHQDSGLRAGSGLEAVIDIPPSYTAA